jgi:hypothetical protein
LRNQRFFCTCLRSKHLVERLGTQTRSTPLALALFLAEWNPGLPPPAAACAPHGFLRCDGGDEQVRIEGAPMMDLLIDHDLVFRFLRDRPGGVLSPGVMALARAIFDCRGEVQMVLHCPGLIETVRRNQAKMAVERVRAGERLSLIHAARGPPLGPIRLDSDWSPAW